VDVLVKRVYEPASADDGYRVLVDRLWPRGLSKERARVDEWLRELAPSEGLRRWFAHRPERFAEFRDRYRAELANHAELIERLREQAASGRLTLLYAARDEQHNNAQVVAELLRRPS